MSQPTPVAPIPSSLRDWLAGMALTGQLASMTNAEVVKALHGALSPAELFGWAAASAYGYADAMLAEREKTSGRVPVAGLGEVRIEDEDRA